MLENMIKNRQYSDDPVLNKKLYELFKKNFQKYSVRNDELDLESDHMFEVPFTTQHQPVDTTATNSANRRVLSQVDPSQYTVKKLTEPYPKNKCYNNGKLVNQT